jgi:hypothetical protein
VLSRLSLQFYRDFSMVSTGSLKPNRQVAAGMLRLRDDALTAALWWFSDMPAWMVRPPPVEFEGPF